MFLRLVSCLFMSVSGVFPEGGHFVLSYHSNKIRNTFV
nr:MAG TPA: hypothetical protein [Caudoviricetes sp.]